MRNIIVAIEPIFNYSPAHIYYMKKTTIVSCIIFLSLLAAGGYYVIQPEIKPKEILSSVRSLFETEEETSSREIREAMECKPDKPLSRGERYALAMKEYWQRQVNGHWGEDEWIEKEVWGDAAPRGYITINEQMCGLEEERNGHPKSMRTDSCYPFRLNGYPTLEALLKKQPEFVSENSNTEFADVVRKNLDGKKYDPAGEGFLQQPEHYHRPSGFGVLKTDSWLVLFYAEDCCMLLSYQDIKRAFPKDWQSVGEKIPIEIRENAEYLKIKYTYIKSKIDRRVEEGGEFRTTIYLINPCGELVDF